MRANWIDEDLQIDGRCERCCDGALESDRNRRSEKLTILAGGVQHLVVRSDGLSGEAVKRKPIGKRTQN